MRMCPSGLLPSTWQIQAMDWLRRARAASSVRPSFLAELMMLAKGMNPDTMVLPSQAASAAACRTWAFSAELCDLPGANTVWTLCIAARELRVSALYRAGTSRCSDAGRCSPTRSMFLTMKFSHSTMLFAQNVWVRAPVAASFLLRKRLGNKGSSRGHAINTCGSSSFFM